MEELRVSAPRSVYDRDAVLLAVQRYLPKWYVTVVSEADAFVLTFRPKVAKTGLPVLDEVQNVLLESAWLSAQAARTGPLRDWLLHRALVVAGKDP